MFVFVLRQSNLDYNVAVKIYSYYFGKGVFEERTIKYFDVNGNFLNRVNLKYVLYQI